MPRWVPALPGYHAPLTQEKREANFRYAMVRVRENAESIAFFNGERSEQESLRAALAQAHPHTPHLRPPPPPLPSGLAGGVPGGRGLLPCGRKYR